jgi:ABC-type branched-subunit amino acid transport system ATPase component
MSEDITGMVKEIMSKTNETLKIEGISVSFGGLKALDNVSLEVKPGQIIGLIGPNGAGKTTLLNVVSGYVTPSQVDKLYLGNINLNVLPTYKRMAQGIGRTFQHAELFQELPIRESILQAASQGTVNRNKAGVTLEPEFVADCLMNSLRLYSYAHAYPSEVPFGIQKVADIARALATGAEIIVMDEPFSGLDFTEKEEVRTILRAMHEAGVSILIIDHVVEEVFDIAEHVVVLDFGKILASGSPAQIQNDAKVLEAYLGSSYTQEEAASPNE